jgi:hypothetical protein
VELEHTAVKAEDNPDFGHVKISFESNTVSLKRNIYLSEKLANKTLIPIYLQEFTYTDNNPCCH